MSKFHSTVSRRTFMKGLGLAGAGLGAAAATAPVFHDLDEVISAAPQNKRPWWVKERDPYNPTVEVDWDTLRAFTADFQGTGHNLFPGTTWVEEKKEQELQALLNNTPGFSLRDYALGEGASFARSNKASNGLDKINFWGTEVTTPEERGVSRWSGTTDEAARMLQAAAHFYGSPRVGFLELDGRLKNALLCSTGSKGRARFEDVDQPSYDGKIKVIPNKCKNMIVSVIRQPIVMTKFLDHTKTPPANWPKINMGGTYGYSTAMIIGHRMQRFVKALGYQALGGYADKVERYNIAAGVLSGLSELGRNSHAVTPEYGSVIRVHMCIYTDLPLPATKPIDAGIHRFCRSCKICADNCPWGCINNATEPTFELEPGNTWGRPGLKKWSLNFTKCHDCPFCDATCPFSSLDVAPIHDVVKTIVGFTPIFDGFFATMDSVFGYGASNAYDEWWDRDLSNYPHDTIQNAGTGPRA